MGANYLVVLGGKRITVNKNANKCFMYMAKMTIMLCTNTPIF